MSGPREFDRSTFDYQRYLASREWAVLKRLVRERARDECERCGLAPVAATHHLTYERLGHELLEDLQGVCGACHDFLSGTSGLDPVAETLRLCGADRSAAIWESLVPRPDSFLTWDVFGAMELRAT